MTSVVSLPSVRATRPPERLATSGLAEIFAPLPPIEWRIEGLRMAPGAAIGWTGSGFVGKTVTAQSIAMSCVSGRPVFGVFDVAPCRVLHVDFEQGRRLTFERYQRLARGMGIDPRELEDRLHVAVLPSVYLDSSKAETVYSNTFDGFGLVIVDSLRAAVPSADENSSEIRRHIDTLTRAGEKTGALPIFLHHARKPSAEAQGGTKASIRGSGAIFDACAGVYVLEAAKGEPARVHHEKERVTGTTLEDFGLAIEDVEIDGDRRGGIRVRHLDGAQLGPTDDATDAKIERLKENAIAIVSMSVDIRSRNAIADRMRGGTRSERLQAIRELMAEERLVQSGKDGPYRLAVT